MCGRFTQTSSIEILKRRFGFADIRRELKPRYNIAPSQLAPVVILEAVRQLDMFRWGLIPSWAKDAAIGNKMVNARAETLLEKPSFKAPFEKRRCLVLADGFFEWQHVKGTKNKIPYRAVLPSREPFAMAGLWEQWKASDGTAFKSFTIITTAANESMKSIHERMPVILKPEEEDRWLDPKSCIEDLTPLLRPWPEALESYAVSPAVNIPANDSPDCIKPAEQTREPEDPQLKLF